MISTSISQTDANRPSSTRMRRNRMTEAAIRIENLPRDFETVRAVDGLSLEVPSGIIFGFLGPNDAGKTTTIWQPWPASSELG